MVKNIVESSKKPTNGAAVTGNQSVVCISPFSKSLEHPLFNTRIRLYQISGSSTDRVISTATNRVISHLELQRKYSEGNSAMWLQRAPG